MAPLPPPPLRFSGGMAPPTRATGTMFPPISRPPLPFGYHPAPVPVGVGVSPFTPPGGEPGPVLGGGAPPRHPLDIPVHPEPQRHANGFSEIGIAGFHPHQVPPAHSRHAAGLGLLHQRHADGMQAPGDLAQMLRRFLDARGGDERAVGSLAPSPGRASLQDLLLALAGTPAGGRPLVAE